MNGSSRLRVLHLIHVLGETNSQYNEHCLPVRGERDLAICPFFTPRLDAPPEISVFPGDNTVPGFFRALASALDGPPYDAVHAHSPQTGTMLALYLLAHPRRTDLWRSTVYTVHDSFPDYKPRNKLLMLPPLALLRRVVFCSESAYASFPMPLRRLVGSRGRIVQNAADLDRVARTVDTIPPPADGPFTVLAVSRLERVKDPLVLLQAFRDGGEDGSRLVLVGEGRLSGAVAGWVSDLGLRERVELTGLVSREEVYTRCVRADVFVSTSRGEGLPVAAMEAMAAGVPSVLSDIPPHRELVGDAQFVPLVPPGDAAGFAREIRRFRELPRERRREVGALCREHVRRRFPLERMHAGYAAVYAELAGGRRRDR